MLLISHMIFNPFKMASSYFRLQQTFPILLISQIQQAPGMDFRMVGKSLVSTQIYALYTVIRSEYI